LASTTFTKRQKERARQEKQRMKAERRLERKRDKQGAPGGGPPIDYEAAVRPGEVEPEEESGAENGV